MGGSSWSDDHYTSRSVDRAAKGVSAFAYDHAIKTDPTKKRECHPDMNPRGKTRESRDSADHPESLAIGVIFDETGSMGGIPVQLQKKLPQLMGLLIRNGYAAHPQVLFGAIGDWTNSEVAPLQIGQFESGLEMDDDLGKLYLEGEGGGSYHESYQNAFYFFGHHTSIDCFEKRGRKGYLFIIGDEMPYAVAKRQEIEALIGDKVQGDVPVEQCIAAAQEQYHCFFIIPEGANHGTDPKLKARWSELLGAQHVIMLKDPDAICEAIGLAVGLCEGATDMDRAAADLAKHGATGAAIATVTSALDPLSKSTALARAGTGNLPDRARPNTTERL